jgi:hypothetical protein
MEGTFPDEHIRIILPTTFFIAVSAVFEIDPVAIQRISSIALSF